jgi:hypothetical protein
MVALDSVWAKEYCKNPKVNAIDARKYPNNH